MLKSHIEKVTKEVVVIDDIFCNCCGKPISKEKTNLCGQYMFDDCLSIDQLWGYSSNKDGREDTFHICENCYDKWISTFKIPIKKVEV